MKKGKNMKTIYNTVSSGKKTIVGSQHKIYIVKKKDVCIQAKTRRECKKYETNLCLGGKMKSFFFYFKNSFKGIRLPLFRTEKKKMKENLKAF